MLFIGLAEKISCRSLFIRSLPSCRMELLHKPSIRRYMIHIYDSYTYYLNILWTKLKILILFFFPQFSTTSSQPDDRHRPLACPSSQRTDDAEHGSLRIDDLTNGTQHHQRFAAGALRLHPGLFYVAAAKIPEQMQIALLACYRCSSANL